MGRGRAKAKQTKVARDLKYSTHGIDPDALLAELAGRPSNGATAPASPAADDDQPDDPYAKYVEDDDSED